MRGDTVGGDTEVTEGHRGPETCLAVRGHSRTGEAQSREGRDLFGSEGTLSAVCWNHERLRQFHRFLPMREACPSSNVSTVYLAMHALAHRMCSTAASPSSLLLAHMTTVAPALARTRQVSRPMPLLPPVTTAVWPEGAMRAEAFPSRSGACDVVLYNQPNSPNRTAPVRSMPSMTSSAVELNPNFRITRLEPRAASEILLRKCLRSYHRTNMLPTAETKHVVSGPSHTWPHNSHNQSFLRPGCGVSVGSCPVRA